MIYEEAMKLNNFGAPLTTHVLKNWLKVSERVIKRHDEDTRRPSSSSSSHMIGGKRKFEIPLEDPLKPKAKKQKC